MKFTTPKPLELAGRILGLGLFFAQAIQPFAQPAPAPAATTAALQSNLTAFAAQPRFAAAALGVKVVSLKSGRTLFEQNAGKLLKPASNAKLYSGALALDRLGPDFRIKTSLYAEARPEEDGTLRGDLTVYGRGDPSFSVRFTNGEFSQILDPLVDALVAAGVKRISGDLVGDETYFRGPPLGDGWAWGDLQYYYGAEVSALTVQDNVVDLVFRPGTKPGEPCRIITKPATDYLKFINRTTTVTNGGRRNIDMYRPIGENSVYVTGSLPVASADLADAVAVHKPALWFVTLLKEALARRGIVVVGSARSVSWPEQARAATTSSRVEIASVASRPLSEMLTRMMKPSQKH